MAERWIALVADEFDNMKFAGAAEGVVRYRPLENASVTLNGSHSYPVEKGNQYIVTVVGNVVHIPVELDPPQRAGERSDNFSI